MVSGGPKRKVSSLEASFSILMDAKEEKATPSISWLGFLPGVGLVGGGREKQHGLGTDLFIPKVMPSLEVIQ